MLWRGVDSLVNSGVKKNLIIITILVVYKNVCAAAAIILYGTVVDLSCFFVVFLITYQLFTRVELAPFRLHFCALQYI